MQPAWPLQLAVKIGVFPFSFGWLTPAPALMSSIAHCTQFSCRPKRRRALVGDGRDVLRCLKLAVSRMAIPHNEELTNLRAYKEKTHGILGEMMARMRRDAEERAELERALTEEKERRAELSAPRFEDASRVRCPSAQWPSAAGSPPSKFPRASPRPEPGAFERWGWFFAL